MQDQAGMLENHTRGTFQKLSEVRLIEMVREKVTEEQE